MIFFFLLFKIISPAVYPPAFLIDQALKQKKTLSFLKIVADLNYKGETFKETVLYKAPHSFRIILEKESDAILFIREENDCIAISKNKTLDIKCSNYQKPILNNLYFNTGAFYKFLNSFDIKVSYNDDEIKIDKNTLLPIKPQNLVLLKNEDRAIFVFGIGEEDMNPDIEEAKLNKITKVSDFLINKILYLKPQIWFDQEDLQIRRIFGKLNGKKTDLKLSFYSSDADGLQYPKNIDVFEEENLLISYKINEYDSKLKISDNLFNLSSYKDKFKEPEKNSLSNNKTILLNYLREQR